MKKITWLCVLLLGGAALPAVAAVGVGYTLFGAAAYISPGDMSNRAVKLVSDATASPQLFSGIDFAVPADLAIGQLNELETDYDFTAQSCALGSPRFGISLKDFPDKTIFVYIGPPPNYTGCAPGWTASGNLLTATSLVDDSQLGGSPSDTWANAQTRFAGEIVTDIFLVSDNGPGSGGLGSQTVLIDNTDVAGTTYDYEFTSKDDCKNGGWQNFTFPPGPFANQGQCVSHFAQ